MLFLSKAFTSQMARSSDIGKTAETAPVQEIEEEDDGFVYLDDIKAEKEASEISDIKEDL